MYTTFTHPQLVLVVVTSPVFSVSHSTHMYNVTAVYYFAGSCTLAPVTTAYRPTMSELISMQKRDGSKGKLRIIEWITAHKLTQCVDFAHKLLVDPLPVKKLSTKHEERKEEFVRAVLQKWLDRDDDDESEESLPCTWDALIQCCEDANLDGVFIKQLRGNIPK